MLDLETLDTAATGVILAIGAVRFNETTLDDNAFYRIISLESNLAEQRTISASTLRWWMQQKPEAQAIFHSAAAVPLEQALNEYRQWMGKAWESTEVWGNGSDFDCAMLTNAYGAQGAPWSFYNTRCFRTVKSMPSAKKVLKPPNPLAHNALADAQAQAQHLQAIWAAGIGK